MSKTSSALEKVGHAQANRIQTGKFEYKLMIEQSTTRWDCQNRFDEVGCNNSDLIHSVADREEYRALVNTEMNLRVPKSGIFITNWVTISF
jgi:hypothetical protein